MAGRLFSTLFRVSMFRSNNLLTVQISEDLLLRKVVSSADHGINFQLSACHHVIYLAERRIDDIG